jgi:hypothetical protein
MISKKRKIGDSGIRLKPNEPNILENFTKYRKRKKTKKRKPKRKKTTKNVEIKEKKDPLLQIVEESQNKSKEEIVVEEIKPTQQIKTIHVDNKPQDLSEKDPNVKKTVKITASLKPDKDKRKLIV